MWTGINYSLHWSPVEDDTSLAKGGLANDAFVRRSGCSKCVAITVLDNPSIFLLGVVLKPAVTRFPFG
jgi:hypothetical protein